MTLEQIRASASKCWKDGGKSTDNPWPLYSYDYGVWMEQWGLCSDDYMEQPGRALDELETGGDEK